jgi:hypothetical protein
VKPIVARSHRFASDVVPSVAGHDVGHDAARHAKSLADEAWALYPFQGVDRFHGVNVYRPVHQGRVLSAGPIPVLSKLWSQVRPSASVQQTINGSSRNAVLVSQRALRQAAFVVAPNYFLRLSLCEHGKTMTCSEPVSPLRYFVSDVVRMGARKQMIWSYAGRIIATMADHCAFRDFAKSQLVRDAVRSERFNGSAHRELSIAECLRPNPIPARFGLFDSQPEASDLRFCQRDCHA